MKREVDAISQPRLYALAVSYMLNLLNMLSLIVSCYADDSRISQNASTAIGGVLRDDGSNFVKAFCANVENCSITRAELGNIVEGLKLAWSLGIRKVIVQSDSKVAISILQSVDRLTHKHTAIMADFQALRARDWEVSIPRIDREANRGDDYLANLGHSFCIGLHLFSFPDSSLAHWLSFLPWIKLLLFVIHRNRQCSFMDSIANLTLAMVSDVTASRDIVCCEARLTNSYISSRLSLSSEAQRDWLV
ncbi:Putative ribonuclease H protein At1g65750 [Linum perenne]